MSENVEIPSLEDVIPIVNFRPILPGCNPNLYRSSAPEAAAAKIDLSDAELEEAEEFVLKEVHMIVDLRQGVEGHVAMKEKLVQSALGGVFEVHADEVPEEFQAGQRYMVRIDFLGRGGNFMDFIDRNWLSPNELEGLDEKQVFQKRRSSFNSRGLAGLNVVLLEQKESMFLVLKLITQYLEQAPDAKLLVHCTAGKDRTGMVCMLLQCVAGFTEEQIISEYIISEAEAKHITAQALKNHKNSFVDPEIMSGADTAGINGALSHLQEKYGGVETYLDDIGFDLSWRERLKKVLVKL